MIIYTNISSAEDDLYGRLTEAYWLCTNDDMSDDQKRIIWSMLVRLFESRRIFERLAEWTINEFGGGKTEPFIINY